MSSLTPCRDAGRAWRRLAAAALVLCCSRADAESRPRPSLVFDPIVVTATRVSQPMGGVPAAVSVIEDADIHEARLTVGLDEPLNRVPGVLVQNSGNFAQDFRVQIRGFGTRAAFGVREIKFLVDGIPETLPDGQTQLDAIDLGAVDRIEVLRGPASSLYGNASGGVVQFFTAEPGGKPWAELGLSGGGLGFQKYQIKGGGSAGRTGLFLQGSFFRLDGFREHSQTRSGVVTAKLRHDIGESTSVTLLAGGVESPRGDDAGALTREEVRRDRRQARAANVALDAGEAVRQGRLGVVAGHRTSWGEVSAHAYGLYRDFENRLPIRAEDGDGIVTFHRFSPGGGAQCVYEAPLLGIDQTASAGIEVQYQDDERRRFANLDGRRGALGLHQRERVASAGAYWREAVSPFDGMEISGGVRYDSIRFRADTIHPPGGADDGSRTMDAWSTAGGARYTPREWLSIYANYGTAFQAPTTTELADPDGAGFNPALEPQSAASYEAGARLEYGERLRAGVTAFLVDIDDELIPFESESGRIYYRNAGSSRRHGVELEGQAMLGGARWTSAVTVIDAEFREYETPAGDFGGKREPGIPSWQVYQELLLRHESGWYAAVEGFAVDGYPVDDADTARSRGYHWLNLRAGYALPAGGWTVEPFAGVNNLTGSKYDGTVRINAQGGRFFEPAPELNAYGGVRLALRM